MIALLVRAFSIYQLQSAELVYGVSILGLL